jgi:hypothetical protein
LGAPKIRKNRNEPGKIFFPFPLTMPSYSMSHHHPNLTFISFRLHL